MKKKIFIKSILLGVFGLCSSPLLASVVEQISLPSADGNTVLTGEIEFPELSASNEATQFPLVFMVPGTGSFDRDVLFGATQTDRDFVFRDLAKQLVAEGIAVARYDYRGISCSIRTMPACPECQNPQQRLDHYLKSCIKNEVRATVTPENVRSDIQQLYEYAAKHKRVDAYRTAFFAHSEGTVHVSRIVASGSVQPTGLVYMGMVGESPQGVVHWQAVGRYMRIFDWGSKPDVVTNNEIKAGYTRDKYFSALGVPVEGLLSPTESWTRSDFEQILDKQYQSDKAEILSKKDEELWPSTESPHATYRWWKMWFSDDVKVATSLCDFKGHLIAHNGSNDSQTPGIHEFDIAKPILSECGVKADLVLHQGKGHGLSDSPIMGPVDQDAAKTMVNDFKKIFGL